MGVLALQKLLPGLEEPGLPRHSTQLCRCFWVFRKLLPCRNVCSFSLNYLTFSMFSCTPGSSGEHTAAVPWYHLAPPVLPQCQQGWAPSRQGSGQEGRS